MDLSGMWVAGKMVVDDLWVPAIIQDKSNPQRAESPVTYVTPHETTVKTKEWL
jgi:hypothetical protein